MGQGRRARRSILAHELAHVVQQRRSGAPMIQRAVTLDPDAGELYTAESPVPVDPRRQRLDDLRGYVAELSPDFRVEVSGELLPNAGACDVTSRLTDRCLCEMCAAPTPWTVVIDDAQWPHTATRSHQVVLQSTLTPMAKGAWGGGLSAGTRIYEGNGRVFGHELCGHAWLIERGVHPTASDVVRGGRYMARPSHDPTVRIENEIGREIAALHGGVAEERGLYTSPQSGESFGRVAIEGFEFGRSSVPPAMAPRLDLIARFVRETEARSAGATDPTVGLDVIGHADHDGAAWANEQVSRERAVNVVIALGSRGVPQSRGLTIEGRSDRECPPGPGRDPSCRRVDVFIFSAKAASERYPAPGAMTPQIASEQAADTARILGAMPFLTPVLTRP